MKNKILYEGDNVLVNQAIDIVVDVFENIFFWKMNSDEIIYLDTNDPNNSPFFRFKPKIEIHIKINGASLAYMVSQLSHELTHYIFYSFKENKNEIALRYEEIIAEAMALYTLDLAIKNIEESLKNEFINYLNLTLKNYATNGKIIPISVRKMKWKILNESSIVIRNNHYDEVLNFYIQLKNKEINIKEVFNYTPFILKNNSIDFDSWYSKTQSKTIKNISYIQPKIK